jgi:DNA-binding beta-propeller fold protein YncE
VALNAPDSITVRHDGRNVYVASSASFAVVAVARDRTTGELIELDTTLGGCVSADGTGGACATGNALLLPLSVTASPDGKHVYVASFSSSAVAAFARVK